MIYLTLLSLLSIAAVTDMQYMQICNRLILCGLLYGLGIRIMGSGFYGVQYFILNITIPVVLLYLLFQMRALGAGDIKLFSVVGSFITTEQLIKVMLYSFVIAAILGVGKVLYLHLGHRKQGGEKLTKIHFSIAILLAVILTKGGM